MSALTKKFNISFLASFNQLIYGLPMVYIGLSMVNLWSISCLSMFYLFLSMVHLWSIYGLFMVYIWSIYGLYRSIYGPSMVHLWYIYGTSGSSMAKMHNSDH